MDIKQVLKTLYYSDEIVDIRYTGAGGKLEVVKVPLSNIARNALDHIRYLEAPRIRDELRPRCPACNKFIMKGEVCNHE